MPVLSNDSRTRVFLLTVFVICAILAAADLRSDLGAGAEWTHLTVEACLLLGAISGVIVLIASLYRFRKTERLLRRELHSSNSDVQRFRQENRELLQGLGVAIDRQFESWGLSPAEAEVGQLLIKGLPFRTIAEARGSSERTVRTQARALYRKAGITGRTELSAFFLEDLLAGNGQEDASDEPPHGPG